MPRLTEKRKRQLEVEANGAKASSGLRELLDEIDILQKELKKYEEEQKLRALPKGSCY